MLGEFRPLSLLLLQAVLLLLTAGLVSANSKNCETTFKTPDYLNQPATLRVALAQPSVVLGDFESNQQKILTFITKAAAEKVDLLVFPEMVVSAYPPRDLIERKEFITANLKSVETILIKIKSLKAIPQYILLGSIYPSSSPIGKPLQNTALVIKNGKLAWIQPKRLLPNYDVFDENRYFHPGTKSKLFKFNNKITAGCTICEDGWEDSSGNISNVLNQQHPLYGQQVANDLRAAQIIANLSASPFVKGKNLMRQQALSAFAQKSKATIAYANQVGAHDDILFDGASFILSQHGEILFQLPEFSEALGIADLHFSKNIIGATKLTNEKIYLFNSKLQQFDRKPIGHQIQPSPEMNQIYLGLLMGIRDYLAKNNFQKVVLGLSGGIDSALVATLLADALGPENVLGVLMPSRYNSAASITDAQALAQNLKIHWLIAPIQSSVNSIQEVLNPHMQWLNQNQHFNFAKDDTTEDNIQARLRGVYIMAMANKFNMLAINTSNKSELAVGQCTTYGDMAGALSPLGDLFKTEVYALARHLNNIKQTARIPEAIFSKPASAELAFNQTDEAKFGPFAVLDQVLKLYLEDQKNNEEISALGFDLNYVNQTIQYVKQNEFKRRQAAIILKVSTKSFGPGRRIPIAAVK